MTFGSLQENHQIHGLLGGLGVYYFLNKQGNKNAMLYGVGTGGFLYWYMSRFQHQYPWDIHILGDFNKEFAKLTGT